VTVLHHGFCRGSCRSRKKSSIDCYFLTTLLRNVVMPHDGEFCKSFCSFVFFILSRCVKKWALRCRLKVVTDWHQQVRSSRLMRPRQTMLAEQCQSLIRRALGLQGWSQLGVSVWLCIRTFEAHCTFFSTLLCRVMKRLYVCNQIRLHCSRSTSSFVRGAWQPAKTHARRIWQSEGRCDDYITFGDIATELVLFHDISAS